MFGERLKELRTARKLTQTELGEKIGASQLAISTWERNVRRPDLDMVVTLADFFGVSIDELLCHTEKIQPQNGTGLNEFLIELLKSQPTEMSNLILDFLQLPDEQQQRVIGYLEGLKASGTN